MSAGPRIVSPRAGRTFYNVADALFPPGADGAPGAGDRDLLPALTRGLRHAGPGAARRFWWLLACIEWLPVATLGSRRSFSRLAREDRQRWLRRAARLPLPGLRRGLAELRAAIDAALQAPVDSGPEPAASGSDLHSPHSSDGA